MYSGIVEFISAVLFVGCAWDCVRREGRDFALQWFLSAYIYSLLRELVATAFLLSYAYSPQLQFFGAAPLFVCLGRGSLFYLAFQFARRFAAMDRTLGVAGLIFVITASFALPLEVTAVQLQWWVYNSPRLVVFGGVPLFVPVVWGAGAAIFYLAFARVERTILPARGKLYAMVTLAPVIAVVELLVAFLFQV